MPKRKEKVYSELEQIRRSNPESKLYVDEVIAFAVDPDTALHSKFEWDNDKAGHRHRRWQARRLIEAHVTIIPNASKPVPVYVSLTTDRSTGGGFRYMPDVLSSEELKKQLLLDAIRDLEVWERKYNRIVELRSIVDAKDALKKTLDIA